MILTGLKLSASRIMSSLSGLKLREITEFPEKLML